MVNIYQRAARPILFRFDPERIHNGSIAIGGLVGQVGFLRAAVRALYCFDDDRLRQQIAGITFDNPIGLAAGFDKNAKAVHGLESLGFGAIEVGSVSARTSEGNLERPRLFRLMDDDAIVVYYGVPNDGAEKVSQRLKGSRLRGPLGVNLVETNTGKHVSAEEVIVELFGSAKMFVGIADYLSLNLNCPNTTGGNSPFEDAERIRGLLCCLKDIEDIPPTFVKLTATDDPQRRDSVLEAIDEFSFVKGIIFNLPSGKPYENLKTPVSRLASMPGTLCGRPVAEFVNQSIRAWYPHIDQRRHIIIGSGGIFSAEDAYEKIQLGASLLQVYTALVFRGPSIVKRINKGLCGLLRRDGFNHLSEAIGTKQDAIPAAV